ncbi:MAG: DUF4175 domain-containing protein, partial [Bacteroidetes bacterium]|nr:DUF4175 domain-containing protein [Bacteroidota bacterium]
MSEQYNILLDKLDMFIRKYYKNQLLRGGIYFLSLFIAFFIVVNLLEYYGNFGIFTRTLIFYLYLALNLLVLILNVVIPLLKLFRFGKIITNEQAARIIGNHFQQVSDKLLNTLQLRDLSSAETKNIELVRASIDQKIKDLKPIPFGRAIDLKKNTKYLKYAVPPLFFLLVILFASPSLITEPTKRLVNHNQPFEKKLPFRLVILNDKLEAVQYDNFVLQIKAEGEEVPDQIFIETDHNKISMIKENPVRFSYSFLNIQKPSKFRLIADKFRSEEYLLSMLPKPVIIDFEMALDYPDYTGKTDELIRNTGDVVMPVGTQARWKFFTSNTDNLTLRFKENTIILDREVSNSFEYNSIFFESQNYMILSSNAFLKNQDSLFYSINIIPDQFPVISVEEYRDSAFLKQLFFKGLVKDDYGFRKLTFNYRIKDEDLPDSDIHISRLQLNGNFTPQQFYFNFDLTSVNIKAGTSIEYYFEIWDNDAINGSKSSRSQMMEYRLPDIDEINQQTEESNRTIKEQMEEAINEAKQLQKDIEELNKKMIDKKELSWEDKEQIQSML